MCRIATKSVFIISDKARFKSAYSAIERSKKIEISLASLDMILKKEKNDTGQSGMHRLMRGSRKFCQRGSNFDVFFFFVLFL